MCYMWNGELRHGNPPNPELEAFYLKRFEKYILSGKWLKRIKVKQRDD